MGSLKPLSRIETVSHSLETVFGCLGLEGYCLVLGLGLDTYSWR